jgi:hypothetical protein
MTLHDQMTTEQIEGIVKTMMTDKEPVKFTLDVSSAWLILSALQWSSRQPDIGDHLRFLFVDIGVRIQNELATRHPDAWPVMRAGWDPSEDLEIGEETK